MKPQILLIDDSDTIQAAIASVLAPNEYLLTMAASGAEGVRLLAKQKYDLILLDYSLPDIDGLHLLEKILAEKPDLPVIMVTGSGSERIAVEALKTGAADYVVKSEDFLAKLPRLVRDTLEKHEMKRRNRELENQLRASYKEQKRLNRELEEKVQARTEELERAYQLSNELMSKAVDSNMQLAELYSEVDESRRKLDAKIRELALLNDVGKVMAATLEQDALLRIALEAVRQELGVEHCAILLLPEHGRQLQIGASCGAPDDLLLAAKSLQGEQVLFKALKDHAPLLIQDVEAHEQFRGLARDYPGVEGFMLVPLRVKNLELGVFTVYGYEQRDTLTKEDVEFVSAIASQAAIALANMRLTNQRIREEQLSLMGKLSAYVIQEQRSALEPIRTAVAKIGAAELELPRAQLLAQHLLPEIERMAGIVQELLEFAQGQRGTLQWQTASVADFMQELLPILERRLTPHHIVVQANSEYAGPFTADLAKMQQVFFNLAENACAAMPGGGVLTITARESNDHVQFEFSDDGGGAPPDWQARLFEPFAPEEYAYGTGFGMAIVKKIIDEHHARIEVRSVMPKGAAICISLPRRPRS